MEADTRIARDMLTNRRIGRVVHTVATLAAFVPAALAVPDPAHYRESGNPEVTAHRIVAASGVNKDDDEPILSNPIPDTLAFVGQPFVFTFAENTFTSPEGNPLTYRATRHNGRPLPDWLDFDGPSRTFTGTPGLSDSGKLRVRVTATDEEEDESVSDEFEISVEEAASNEPPTFTSAPITEATEGVLYRYSVTTSDPDGDALTISGEFPPWLSLIDYGNETADLTGTPAEADVGAHEVTLRVTDGSDTDTQVFTIDVAAVNDPPTTLPDSYTVLEGQLLVATAGGSPPPGVLDNDTDSDGDMLSAVLVSGPSSGELALEPDGSFTYQHDGSGGESDSFVYAASDGTLVSADTPVTITIVSTNDPPVFTSMPVTVALQGTTYRYEPVATDEDAEDILTLTALQLPGWLSFTDQGGGKGLLTGTPRTADVGDHPVRLQVEDGSGETDVQAFSISVGSSNSAPTATGDRYQVEEGGTLVARAGGEPPGVLDNDTDPDGNVLTITPVSQVSHGVLSLDPDGSFTYTHDGSETTSDSFEYIANDGIFVSNSATVQIDVVPVNDPPHFTSTPLLAATIGRPYSLAVAATDPDGPDLTLEGRSVPPWLTFVDNGNGTGSLSGTPDENDVGLHDVVLVASDGLLSTEQAFSISVRTVNSPPLVQDDEYSVLEGGSLAATAGGQPGGVLDNDSDEDGDPLIAHLVGTARHGELTFFEDGSFRYVHDGAETIEDFFSYRATDGEAESASAVVRLSITAVNDSPVAVDDDFTIMEDTESRLRVLANDTDEETKEELRIHSITDPLHGRVEADGDSVVVYSPDEDFNGSDFFAYLAVDPGGLISDSARVHITVVAVNDAPRLTDDFAATGTEAPVIIRVLDNDFDPDGDVLSVQTVGDPRHGTVSLGEGGAVTYVPGLAFEGEDQFTYVASDPAGASAQATVTVAVSSLRFSVTEVGTPDGASQGFAIDDRGWVAGSSRSGGGKPAAFMRGDGGIVQLETGADNESLAFDINTTGDVVGVVASEQKVSAVKWTVRSDKVESLELPGLDGEISVAYGTNEAGETVGLSLDAAGRFQPVLWMGESLVRLYDHAGLDFGQAQSINDARQIAGFIEVDGAEYGIVGTPDDVQVLDDRGSRAYAISGTGEVVGSMQGGGSVSAVKWHTDGAMTPLPSAGATFAEAYGINDSGWIVGTVATSLAKAGQRYSLFTNDPVLETYGVTRRTLGDTELHTLAKSGAVELRAALWLGESLLDLNDFIPSGSGWVLIEARDVNNAGQITGTGLVDGRSSGFVVSLLGNSPPKSHDDSVVRAGVGPLTIKPLENDSDPDGDVLTVVAVTEPLHGSARRIDAETIEYVADEGFPGDDSFNYTVVDGKGGSDSGEIRVSVQEDPTRFGLFQNHPNPFNEATTITYTLAHDTYVNISVYDAVGRLVSTLVDREQPAGRHSVDFGPDDVSTGIYLCRMRAGSFSAALKLVRFR